MRGGAPESGVGATKVHWLPLLGSLKNLTTGLIWLVTGRGGWGEAWGGGGSGRRWGHQKARGGGVWKWYQGRRRVDKMWSGRWPGLEKGERRVWGHHDTRVVGAERQIKKESTNAGKW